MKVTFPQLAAALLACSSSAVQASRRGYKNVDNKEELPSTTTQADEEDRIMIARRMPDENKAPTPEPYYPPTDDYAGTDDYYGNDTPQPTTTWYPTKSPWPTRSPLPTVHHTRSPHPTPEPTPYMTKSPWPTPYMTKSPWPTPDPYYPETSCLGKPLTVEVAIDGTYLIFCCVQGAGDFDVHSAFNFHGCALAPPDYTAPPSPVAKPTPKPTPHYPPVEPPTLPPYPVHPPSPPTTETHDKVTIHLALKTDHYPDQTSFTLQNAVSGEYLWDYDYNGEMWQPNAPYHYQVDVDPKGCYYFIILDTWGDGLASWGGSFELYYSGYLTWYGSMFGKYSSVAVGEGCYYMH